MTGVAHGTTVATNTLLERNGAVTALITTKGFRDVLDIGRQSRPELYDLHARKPASLIPRYLRREADERMDYTGTVLVQLDMEELKKTIHELMTAVSALQPVGLSGLWAGRSRNFGGWNRFICVK